MAEPVPEVPAEVPEPAPAPVKRRRLLERRAPAAPALASAPHVSEYAKESAFALAQKVWARNELSKAVLTHGMNQSSADEWLDYAVKQDWVVVDGNRVLRGSVNPAPMSEVYDESSREHKNRWGWGPTRIG